MLVGPGVGEVLDAHRHKITVIFHTRAKDGVEIELCSLPWTLEVGKYCANARFDVGLVGAACADREAVAGVYVLNRASIGIIGDGFDGKRSPDT